MAESLIKIRRIETDEGFLSLKDTWNTVLAGSPSESFFQRWEWLYHWWQAYRREDLGLMILLAYRGEDLVGIGPFYVARQVEAGMLAARGLFFLGTCREALISEYMDMISRPGYEEDVVDAMFLHICESGATDEMSLHNIPSESPTIERLERLAKAAGLVCKGRVRESPYIPLPGDWGAFMEGLSPSMRSKIRAGRRRLGRYPDAAIRSTTTAPGEFEEDFREFKRLHQKRWEALDKPGSFSGGKFEGFLRSVSEVMLKEGLLRLSFLSVAGRNIAALYNINYKGRVYFFQSGLDASFDRSLAPGLLLHADSIEEAIRSGMKEYDFLLMGKTDDYKKRWTRSSRRLSDIEIYRPGIIRRILSVKGAAKARIGRYLNGTGLHKGS